MRPTRDNLRRAPPASIDQTVSDFDGVTFHISTPEAKTRILVSIQIRCFKDLVRYGAEQVLQREYGSYVVPPEDGYDFSIQVDLENLPAEKGTNESDLPPTPNRPIAQSPPILFYSLPMFRKGRRERGAGWHSHHHQN